MWDSCQDSDDNEEEKDTVKATIYLYYSLTTQHQLPRLLQALSGKTLYNLVGLQKV